jgi:hypothetical protein
MTRREIHQSIVWGCTIVLLVAVVCIALFVEQKFAAFATLAVAYMSAMFILPFIFRRNILPHLRKKPDAPPEFRQIFFGPITAEVADLLAQATVVKDGEFRKRRHVLYRWEKSVPEGVWTGYAEEAAEQVVAWGVEFRSVVSPVLDFSESEGEGQFICLPSS